MSVMRLTRSQIQKKKEIDERRQETNLSQTATQHCCKNLKKNNDDSSTFVTICNKSSIATTTSSLTVSKSQQSPRNTKSNRFNSIPTKRDLTQQIIHKAIQQFQSGFYCSTMVSREKEFQEIRQCIINSFKSKQPASLYICGAPGTGKTSTTLQILEELEKGKNYRFTSSYTNGAILASVEELLVSLLTATVEKESAKSRTFKIKADKVVEIYNRSGLEAALTFISKQRKTIPCLVILDEADQINNLPLNQRSKPTSSQSRSLFEELVQFALQPQSNFILISISNALHLGTTLKNYVTEKRKTLIKASSFPTKASSLDFYLIVFETYTEKQLKMILERRFELARIEVLKEYEQTCTSTIDMKSDSNMEVKGKKILTEELRRYVSTFQPIDEIAAMIMLKRLAAHQGDCRQMLDVCRNLLNRYLEDSDKETIITAENQTACESPPSVRRRRRACYVSSDESELYESPQKKIRSSENDEISDRDSESTTAHDSEYDSEPSSSLICSNWTEASTPTSTAMRKTEDLRSETSRDSSSPQRSQNNSHFRNAYHSSSISNNSVDQLSEQVGKISLHSTTSVLNSYFELPKSRCSKLMSRSPLHQQVLLLAVCQASKEKGGNELRTHKKNRKNNNFGEFIDATLIQNAYKAFCLEHHLREEYHSVTFFEGLSALEQSGILVIHTNTKKSNSKQTSSLKRSNSSFTTLSTNRNRIMTLKTGPMLVTPSRRNGVSNLLSNMTVELSLESSDIEDVLSQLKSVFRRALSTDE